MYQNYRETNFWDLALCPSYRGLLYCGPISEGPLSEVPLYIQVMLA